MGAEAVEVVRALYDAIARHDTVAVFELYDPDVEFDATGWPAAGIVGGTVYRGHDGLREWFREWDSAWEEWEDELEELAPLGDRAISVVTRRGTGRASGVAVEWRYVGLWTISDGKVVRVQWFDSRDDAVAAARLE